MAPFRNLCRPVAVAALVALIAGPAVGQSKTPTPQQVQFFETKVRPVLVQHCFKCHGAGEKPRGELRLDSLGAVLLGGESGAAIVPGDPAKSLLIQAVNYQEREMPPGKKLGKAEIAALTEWVRMGAPWPGSTAEVQPVAKEGFKVTPEDRKTWAFQPVVRPKMPDVGGKQFGNPLDAFIAQKLQAKGLHGSPPASPRELIRRAYFDLIGLPPSPEAVAAFVADKSPDAYAKLLDRLLAMPQYGERWGRHWLDVVRFAQTSGYERDDEKQFAWRYRDYVIKSLNEDKPFDRFIREQLAGDELRPLTDDGLIATGFYRLGVWDDEPDDARQAEFDDLDDMLATTSNAFLGVTLGCARCHDHKFDPIGQQDYYSMLAFVRNVKPHTKPGKAADGWIFAKLSSGDKALAVHEYGREAKPTNILIRGSAGSPGKRVEPAFVRVLCPTDAAAVPALPEPADDAKTSGRRTVLADWVASPKNPLTARVIVNRLWQHHFGRGIVATPNDFGKTGVAPTHPELLDWLAAELVEGGWKLKRLHKLIMLSETYRQSSRVANDKALTLDPGNKLLWRQNLRRLEAEAIRDTMLAVSGQLNLKMGGRGIFPTLPKEVLSTQSRPGSGWDKSSKEESRRSVYVFVKRTLGVPLLETFDVASPDTSTAVRATTTIAPQALMLLNSAFMDEQAEAFAGRLLKAGGQSRQHVERMFLLALARQPTAQEMKIALDYLERNRQPGEAGYRRALAMLCKVALNLNELVYVD